jgi:hypothetical protein
MNREMPSLGVLAVPGNVNNALRNVRLISEFHGKFIMALDRNPPHF